MNKETVKKNLKFVFTKEIHCKIAAATAGKTYDLKEEAEDDLRNARGFLRKAIGDSTEIYVANIDGKNYKIMPNEKDEFDVLIKEIKIIK